MEAPEFYNVGGYINGAPEELFPKKRNAAVSDQKPAGGDVHFAVDDLLDFPNDDADDHDAEGLLDNITTTTDSCNSSAAVSPGGNVNASNYQSFADSCFSSELSVPYDDLAELEWLSNFVEDSFSTDQNLQITNVHFLSGPKPLTVSESSSSGTYPEHITGNIPNNLMFQSDMPLPGKARSKRSRAAPCNWTTSLLQVSREGVKAQPKKERIPNQNTEFEAVVRRCTHCASEKTPQWRTGPMGPKTLCNACGVRFKSGRLVPEYRPAASPTFVPTKHSNSHRKVMELRRQQDMHRAQHEKFLNQRSIFGVTNGGDDFSIHHRSGPSFRHIM